MSHRDDRPDLMSRGSLGECPEPRLDNPWFRPRSARRFFFVMHFIYLDESGDPGMNGSPTNHYILAGFALTASDWHKVQRRFALFRQWAFQTYGLDPGRELHASEFLGAASMHCGLPRATRLLIMRRLIGMLTLGPELRFFGWIASKERGDPLERVGVRCLEDLEAWSAAGYFGECHSLLIIHDRMPRRPSAWKRPTGQRVIESPLCLDSETSPCLQVADLIAYLLKQSLSPNRYLKEQGAQYLIKKLNEKSLGWRDV